MELQLDPGQPRNLQLDFFRGIALMIIFINHMPGNLWFWYTPSQFGLSDAADIFVFISGFTSAIVYGRCFDRAGLWLGCVRILHRCGQIYAAHLASFFMMAAICVLANRLTTEVDYIQRLNTGYFFENTQQAVVDIIRLNYVPNYFDILPMYLVLLLWVPIVWALSRLHSALALTFSILIYCAARQYDWELTADPATGRPWYFNPFNWQLLFFTGFGFGAGWLRIPGKHWGLMVLCALIVMVSIPLGHEATYTQFAFWADLRAVLEPFLNKSHLGPIRCVHLLALAYLMNQLFKSNSYWLKQSMSRWIIKMGQQSLPIFLCGMGLSYIGGVALDWSGDDALSVAMVNLAGLGLLLLLAQVLAWLDSKPWKLPASRHHPNPSDSENLLLNLNKLAYDWGKQVLLLPFLIGLAVLPILLAQTEKAIGTRSADIMANLPRHEDVQKVNAVVPRADQPDTVIENQQRL